MVNGRYLVTVQMGSRDQRRGLELAKESKSTAR
jgi:hypothetical protein